MDINQVARMIEWLDEERRRDKATIATLEERLTQQQDTINTLQRRVNGVESDQTVIKTQYVPSTRENDLLEQMRREARQLIEAAEAKRLTAEREAERRAEVNTQKVTRPVQELAEKVTKLERTTTEMPAFQLERDRTLKQITDLQQRVEDLSKKLEEPGRRLAFLEEQRRQDVRRISEMETEIPELRKQVDTIQPKLTLLEDLALRVERRVQEVQNGERDRRDQIQEFIDQQNLITQQHRQQVEDLVRRFGENDEAMQQNIQRFETWAEAYRQMKQIIDDFQRIGDRLERRINEVAEMQRLSEDRFRQEWNDYRSEDQKRWKQFTLSNDDVWRNHDNDFERFVQRLETLGNMIQPLQDGIERLWRLERARAELYRERYQAMLLEFDTKNTTAATLAESTPQNGSASNGAANSNGADSPNGTTY